MSKPDFAWWPYRVLALLVPVLAVGASGLTAIQWIDARSEESVRQWVTVFSIVLGAGNGCLLAIARGDLKRLLIAIIAGASAGLTVVSLLTLPGAMILFAFILLGMLIIGLKRKLVPRVIGFISLAFMLFICFVAIANRVSGIETRATVGILFGFPFVCSIAGTSVVNKWTSVFTAMINASNGAVLGWTCSLPLWAVYFVWIQPIKDNQATVRIAYIALTAMVMNYIFVRHVFNTLRRVESMVSPATPPSTESIHDPH